ncbi:hypothetical protein OESDEN_15968 [Oesophagostomum dentatum]|uniref:Nanos-type domain-containing protein n=1 Tax=Oesophagostomum dentatum TaxID=61180 RepID=A0A0B1SKA4_OESDE|nr:hypothetical protein OESDEN_15968 [Oesophagostomum dentatum]
MLVYRGKHSDTSITSSDSGNSSRSDEQERSESNLSDLLSSPEGVIYEVDGESDADSPPHDPAQESPVAPSDLGVIQQNRQSSSPRQHRFCWYCFDAYKAMCLAQGKAPPSIYSRGLWHGHCMRDSNGVTR